MLKSQDELLRIDGSTIHSELIMLLLQYQVLVLNFNILESLSNVDFIIFSAGLNLHKASAT